MAAVNTTGTKELEEYRAKRKFTSTPEPEGGKPEKNGLRFVVQKHDASRLHYDFRLEMEGVLKSWAIPKGPVLNPQIKHLAMMVEDHPYDYGTFEGIIPDGNYGAGTVIVWDEGFYTPLGVNPGTKKAQEKILLAGLAQGNLKFKLEGHKLHGEFALVKTAYRGENSWLLIKHKDEFATEEDITLEDRSVLSGLTIDEMREQPVAVYGQPEKAKKKAPEKTHHQNEPVHQDEPVPRGEPIHPEKAVR